MTENPSCQHLHINNDTGKCLNCGEQMQSVNFIAETIKSAPNAAACTIPDCDGGEGCMNPGGLYFPNTAEAIEVTVGYRAFYECERCSQDGTLVTPEGISWDCGKSHEGDYVSERR